MRLSERTKYAITGTGAGLINGLFGGGGGMILVPLLTKWLALDEQHAFATSVAITLPLCVVSAAVYLLHGGVGLGDALPYLAGGLVGGVAGGVVFKKVPPDWLRRAFGVLILVSGVRALLG